MKEHSATGNPVGSEELEMRYHFHVSSATIRNEMQVLEKEGLIRQPHTSAGRIPADKGYRYFVNKLMRHVELSQKEQYRLREELSRLQKQYMELGRSIVKLLSETTQGAAFAVLPTILASQPESVATSGLSQVIDESVKPEELKKVARFLDELEKHGKVLAKKEVREVEAFIGREAPLPIKLSDFSLLVSQVRLPSGQPAVIGIVGPKRMKYARNISLLEYVSKLLSSGLGAVVIIFNF